MQLKSVTPSITVIVCAFVCAVAIYFMRRYSPFSIILIGILIGFSWAGWLAHQIQACQLPHSWEGKPILLRGTVSSLPSTDKFGMHFIMTVDYLQYHHTRMNWNMNVRLIWPKAHVLRVGDQYVFYVRLKRIHGMRNPGGYDYEAFAFQQRLRASGAIVAGKPYQYLGHCFSCSPINQFRQKLRERILQFMPSSESSPWLLALMIGDHSMVPSKHWQVLRATGTNHLMAIAGLHIGLISGFVHLFVRALWRRSVVLTKKYPAMLAGACMALLSAWIYSALAGFSIPTQRACIMLTIFIAATLFRRQLLSWHTWSLALLAVLILDPMSVLSESFWLSFCTIALIIYGMSGRIAPQGLWWKWGRVQWVIGIGLMPLSMYFFRETSIVSVLVNCIAIPWLGFLVLPFCLMSSLFLFIWPPLGVLLLWFADTTLAGLWFILSWFAHLDYAVWTHTLPSFWVFIISMIAILVLLLPAGMPGKLCGFYLLLPAYLYQSDPIPHGDFIMTTLDVGQGLSVVIQTEKHALVFDAGPRFSDRFDMGESVVVPFLQSAGIQAVDILMISHGDNDHLGGAAAVMRALPVRKVFTSAVEKFTTGRARLCLAGMHWQWDGVKFRVLYPYLKSLKLGNDSSCVLRIENGRHSVLLTGDIEKFAEKQLLTNNYQSLNTDVVTAPHHGSKTSSQKEFVRAVAPKYVIFATGYRNRYHLPSNVIIKNYTQQNSRMLNTTYSGAVEFKLRKNGAIVGPIQHRIDNNHYWNDAQA